ncbi:MAG TPA: hypothetical protein VFK47_17620, partial [Ktedonobacteraceae bacterium]|nr:hypothetical protein [Ktedonobacteraceae bacterium]
MKRYTQWYVEVHPSMVAIDVNDHIINHLPQRISLGNAIIICDRPEALAAAFSKRWHKVMRTLDRAFASTLNMELRRQLLKKHDRMLITKFSPREYTPTSLPTVWLVTPDCTELPPNCATLYVAVT